MTIMLESPAAAVHARQQVLARHAELQEVLNYWASSLNQTAAAGSGGRRAPVVNLLRFFLADEVLPHAHAEERTLYRAARRDPAVGPLVQALLNEHELLKSMAARLAEPAQPTAIAAQAEAIAALFASHVAKEDAELLPALERSGTDLSSLLAREPLLAGGTRL